MGKIKNYKLIYWLVIFVLFEGLLNSIPLIKYLGLQYLDELIIFFVVINAFLKGKLVNLEKTVFPVVIYFVLISIIQESSTIPNIIIQSFVHLKILFLFIFLNWKLNGHQVIKLLKTIMIVTLIGVVLNILIQSSFNEVLNLKYDYRSGLLRINGFQLNSNNLGITVVLMYILSTSKIRKSRTMYIYTFLAIGFLFLTGSRISIISIVLAFGLWFYLQGSLGKMKLVLLVILLAPAIGYLLSDSDLLRITIGNFEQINEADNTKYIRIIMIYNALKILLMYFPFGAGAATYGTVLSSDSYVYKELGLSSMRFFEEKSGIYDSNWASIIGEFGFLGFIMFTLVIYKLYKYCNLNKRGIYKYPVISSILVFTVSGFTMPVMMNGYTAMLFALFLVYFKKIK